MLNLLWTLGSYIVAIGILVSFHEFGHFWVARRLGIKVLRFSIGFGKPLWSRKANDGVEYVIASIPLGGYVKLLDGREGVVPAEFAAMAFDRQPVSKRIAVFFAGPAFNFLLAIAFYALLFIVGLPSLKPVLAEPADNTVAAAAGIHNGDRVLRLDGAPLTTFDELSEGLLEAGLSRAPAVPAVIVGNDGAERSVRFDFSHVPSDPEKLFRSLGFAPYTPPIEPVIGNIVAGSAAANSELHVGDRILALDDQPMATFQAMQSYVRARPAHAMKARVQRGDQTIETTVIVGTNMENGIEVGRLGIEHKEIAPDDKLWQDLRAVYRLTPWAAVPAAIKTTWQKSKLTVTLLGKMVVGQVSVKNVSGPIQIAQVAGASAKAGLATFIGFIAIISISVGIFNLLPVPMLDGGQILFGVIEAAKGSPLSERLQFAGQTIGIALLILLMSLAFFNDIVRQIG